MFSCHDLIYSMHIRQFLLCISKYSVKIFNSILLEQLIIWIVYLNANNNYINSQLLLFVREPGATHK